MKISTPLIPVSWNLYELRSLFYSCRVSASPRRVAAAYGVACSAPMIDRSILREVKSGPYMLKAGFQKGSMELRTCPLDISHLACVSDLPWRLLAAQHPPPYPEALKFHVKCNFMKFHEISTPWPWISRNCAPIPQMHQQEQHSCTAARF